MANNAEILLYIPANYPSLASRIINCPASLNSELRVLIGLAPVRSVAHGVMPWLYSLPFSCNWPTKYTEVKGDFVFTQEDFLLCLKVGTMGVTIGGIEFWFIYYRQYNSRK